MENEMKNAVNRIKQLRPVTLIAMLALFIAIGGTATAASGLINGKNIKKGTVTAKQLKNKTITKGKLAPSTVKSLKGAKGAKGDQGIQGVPGANGVVSPVADTEIGPENVVANVDKTLAATNVPAGSYAVIADFNYTSASSAPVTCVIKNGASIVSLTSFNGEVEKNSVAINGLTTNATNLSVVCNSTAAGTASNIHLLAIPAQS